MTAVSESANRLVREISLRRTPHRLEFLTSGGVADVYRGCSADNSNAVTVKILQPRFAKHGGVVNRWREEARLLSGLPPTGFPRLIEAGRFRGRDYLAYHYIEGDSVLDVLRRAAKGRFSTSVALCLVCDLLDRLDTLHRRDIVHSDVSPENIIWDGRRAHLIDFGCAQQAVDAEPCSRWIGKAYYLSPEQAQGRNWDQRSDVYQAGILLFELMSGRRLNRANDPAQARIWASQPEPPDYDGIPAPVRPLLHYMLNTDPGKRADNAAHCRTRLVAAARRLGLVIS